MKKASKIIFTFILGLLAIFSTNVYAVNDDEFQEKNALEYNPQINDNTTPQINDNTTPQSNDNTTVGWNIEDGEKWYQSNDGERLTGLQVIDGKKYYFDLDTGYMKLGFVPVDNNVYYFRVSDGAAVPGWKMAYGKKWYQDSEGKVLTGFQVIDGEKYYFSPENYQAQVGFVPVNNDVYYFRVSDCTAVPGWKMAYGKKWYQDSEGKVLTGFQVIDGKKYYFSPENYQAQVGFVPVNNVLYYFRVSDCTAAPGWKIAYGKIWYQDENGIVVTGKQTIENREYIFGTDGYMQGFKNVNGRLYYYNPDGSMAKGVQRMAGNYYKFNEITGAFEKNVNQKIVIDISSHNGVIDWNAVKNSGKVDGVILRLGYSVGFIDTQFLNNVRELNRLGIPYSVYLFSYAANGDEARQEANFVVNTIKGNPVKINSNLFSVYYDLEDWTIKSTRENSYGISKENYGNIIMTFKDIVEFNLGLKARVYASKNYIETRFPSYAQNYATWVAQWGPNITYKGAYDGWQYTNCGSVPGINGCVDMSKFYY